MKTANTKYLLMCISIICMSMKCMAQKPKNKTQTPAYKPAEPLQITKETEVYYLGDYAIIPSKKIISIRKTYGKGKVGSMVGYFPDSTINYSSTNLIALGNQILFKEYFPSGVDFKSLKYVDEGLYKDDKFIYSSPFASGHWYGEDEFTKKIDLKGFTCLNNFIYENKGSELFYLNSSTFKLEKIIGLPNLDRATLVNVKDRYFADKNGLYGFGVHFSGSQYESEKFSEQAKCIQVESANGKNIKPIITRNYIVYNKSVYATSVNSIEKLNLNVSKMIEHPWNNYQNIYFITDGTHLYENENSTYNSAGLNKDNFYANDFLKSGVDILKIYPATIKFAQNSDLKTLYFAAAKQDQKNFTDKSGLLIKTTTGYSFVDAITNGDMRSIKPKKIDQIIIYNYALKKNQVFDENEFLSIDEKMYAYKGLIFFENKPLKEINSANKFDFIYKNGAKTNFITDGKSLIAYGNIYGYQLEMVDGFEKVVFKERIIDGVNIANLKVINENLLVDDNNFYDGSRGSLQIIPIKKLGILVKLLLAD